MCSPQVHSHPARRSHQPAPLNIPKGYVGRGIPHILTRDRLELFAVLCIETSHYVSFVKHGPNKHDWIFFDSMADRQGGRGLFKICTQHVPFIPSLDKGVSAESAFTLMFSCLLSFPSVFHTLTTSVYFLQF